jgi:general stress protein 26
VNGGVGVGGPDTAGRYNTHMSATLTEIAAYVGKQILAVQSSVAASGAPQAAVVGVVANDALELFFDTLGDTRKAANLRRDPRVAFVLGWDMAEACTVQLEGVADEPTGPELEAWKSRYFARFPDGVARQEWPGITYFRVRPTWIRHSDFRGATPAIAEFGAAELLAFQGR